MKNRYSRMNSKYVDEQTFRNVDFSKELLPIADYEYCTFVGCNFSNSSLSNIRFLETEFIDCNFSNATLGNTSFQTVVFKTCKMLGLHFDASDQFGFAASFDACQLDHSSFHRMKLSKTVFNNCQLEGVDFSETDLKNAKLIECNLLHATFQNTNLENADFRKSTNYSFDPEQNRIKNAKFSLPEVIGLLDKYQIVVE